MRRFICLLTALLIGIATGPARAGGGQFGNISGTIVDTKTGDGIAKARVTLTSPSGSFTR
jgi:hypothetical protein